jgi:hypothetical protein
MVLSSTGEEKMAHTPKDSAIQMTPELTEAINNCPPSQMGELLRQAAVDQGLVVRDIYSPDILLPVDNPQPQRFARTVEINGERQVIEGDSQAEVDHAAVEMYRAAQAQPQPQPQPQARPQAQPQPRNPNNGQYRSPGDSVLENLLATHGITLPDLQAAVSRNFTASWADATQEFLRSEAGNSWPGGEENLRRISNKVIELGLVDSPDRVGALATAYAALRDADQLLPNPAIEREREYNEAISNATSPTEIAELSKQYQRG